MVGRDVACILLLGLDVESTVLYASSSIEEILGYKPNDIVGRPIASFFDPAEYDAVQRQRYQTLANDKITDVTFHRYRHKDGHYVLCEAGLGVVHDKFIGSLRRAVEGPRTALRSSTAQDVSAITSSAISRFALDVWDRPPSIPPTYLPEQTPWDNLPTPGARTCFILDRFSADTAIRHVSNDVLYSRPQKFEGVPFYDLVRLSDRQRVREYINFAKSWTGTGDDSLSGSHNSYCRFGIFDDKEGIMEVQAVITAYSDGVVCVIRRREASADLQRTESTSTDTSRQSSGNRIFTELTEERFKR